MKREDVTKIFENATNEQIDSILNINSADIGKAKKDYADLTTELNNTKEMFQKLKDESDKNNAEDFKKKYEDLVAENERKESERQAAYAEAQERAEFDKYFSENKKEWSNKFIADGYFREYQKAKTENKNKTTADILHELTKDDGTAFKGATLDVKLKGPEPHSPLDKSTEEARARAVMGLKTEK